MNVSQTTSAAVNARQFGLEWMQSSYQKVS